jgi:hypothetical protein
VGSGQGTSAAVDWTWDASAAPQGRYTWTIAAGATVRPARGTIGGGSVPGLRITGLVVAPMVVTPNGDGIDDIATVSYVLSAPATVSASVTDVAGVTLSSLLGEFQTQGPHVFTFDPVAVPDGEYRIALSATDPSGTTVAATVPVIVNRSTAGGL